MLFPGTPRDIGAALVFPASSPGVGHFGGRGGEHDVDSSPETIRNTILARLENLESASAILAVASKPSGGDLNEVLNMVTSFHAVRKTPHKQADDDGGGGAGACSVCLDR